MVKEHLDAAHLPEGLVALIDALRPGDELHVTRDGESIATISSTRDPRGRVTESPSSAEGGVTVVATAMKLSASARASLSEQLGPDYLVLDMNSAPESVDMVLTPPTSPQLIGHLRSMFPKARVMIAEIEDKELGISYEGPVRRLLDAGAEVYLPSSTIPRLAEQLDRTMTQLNQIAGDTSTPLTIESPQDSKSLNG